MDEEVVCAECAAEPVDSLEGWDLNGEFGARCPECRLANAAQTHGVGLDAVADAVGVTKKEEP